VHSYPVKTQPAALDAAVPAGFGLGFCTELRLPARAFGFKAVTVRANRLVEA